MNVTSTTLALQAALLLGCTTAHSDVEVSVAALHSPTEMAAELEVTLPRLPWHVVDVWWDFANPTEHFESFSMDVTIDRDVPDTCNLYIAPVGVAKLNGMQFYGGLQSNINGWPSPEHRTRVHPGKGAIFSRWSNDKKQAIGLEHVRNAAGGLCESAGYEGSFCSIRQPYLWTKGTYTYSIIKGDADTQGDKHHTWFHCLVRSHATDATTYIGSLRFEGEDFTFWGRHAAFVEVYSTSKIRRSAIPEVSVSFGYPRLNGKHPALTRAYVNYNPSKSPACARARAAGDAVVVDVGKLFKPTDERAVQNISLQLRDITEGE